MIFYKKKRFKLYNKAHICTYACKMVWKDSQKEKVNMPHGKKCPINSAKLVFFKLNR